MAEEYKDPRAFTSQIFDYLISGTSPSEFRGAHGDINKIIAKADPKSEYAKLFDIESGTGRIGYYRHLDPSDSTVTILKGLMDRMLPSFHSDEERMLMDAKRHANPTTEIDAARALAALRNQLQ